MITVVYFWRIRKAFLPIAIINMAVNKLLLRVKFRNSFIKLLGTGKGESFTPKDADQFRWGLLITIDQSQLPELENSPVIKVWRRISKNEYRALLRPISCHGLWSKKQPFLLGERICSFGERCHQLLKVCIARQDYLMQLVLGKHQSAYRELFQSGKMLQP
jgi:hypothetical protein